MPFLYAHGVEISSLILPKKNLMAEPSMRVDRLFSPIIIILALGAFLLLFHLDHRPFWQDEAETAVLAKRVLTYGVPRAYDGVNLVSQEAGHEYGPNYLWRWSPWLQIYVVAGAFRLGGLTTYAGRLPFALLGLGCIFLVYLLVRHNFRDPAWALMAAALLTCSVPFLLYARQCRYYSLGALFSPWPPFMPFGKSGSLKPSRLSCCVSLWVYCSMRIISFSSVLPEPFYWRQFCFTAPKCPWPEA